DLGVHRFLEGGAKVSRAVGDGDARGAQGGNLVVGGPAAPADDGAGMAHATTRRSSPAGDERRHRLGDVRLDECRRLLLGGAADCSSEVPPISPIIRIASVFGSSWNSRSTSTNDVPATGSPPMPTQVDCPRPRLVSCQTAS